MNRSRRLFLGALPVAALATACGRSTTAAALRRSTAHYVPPTTPAGAIQDLIAGNVRFSSRKPEVRRTAGVFTVTDFQWPAPPTSVS